MKGENVAVLFVFGFFIAYMFGHSGGSSEANQRHRDFFLMADLPQNCLDKLEEANDKYKEEEDARQLYYEQVEEDRLLP